MKFVCIKTKAEWESRKAHLLKNCDEKVTGDLYNILYSEDNELEEEDFPMMFTNVMVSSTKVDIAIITRKSMEDMMPEFFRAYNREYEEE